MTTSNSFKPWIGVSDKLRLERIRRDILNRISCNERQAKLLSYIMGTYPLVNNSISKQKNYLLAVQLYRKDLLELNEVIQQCKT